MWWSARVHLGMAHLADAAGRLSCACRHYREAVRRDTRIWSAWSALARAYGRAGAYPAALFCLDKALGQRPKAVRLHESRGAVLRKLMRLDEAASEFIYVIKHTDRHFNAMFHLAMVRIEQGKYVESLRCFDAALGIKPYSMDIRLNRSLALLTIGDWERGWHEYTACMERLEKLPRALKRVRAWDGRSTLAGKTILLYTYQGFGDALQFCRYIPQVAELGARVIVQAHPALLPLLSRQDFGVRVSFVSSWKQQAVDLRCSLTSLAQAFGTRPDRVPLARGYLRANPAAISVWALRLRKHNGLRVGLVWSGAQAHRNDHNRSIPFQELQGCLPRGIDYVCLQKEIRPADQAALRAAGLAISTYCEDLRDFNDTAALCDHMDLIVCVDTSIAHLAAAMGKPVWLLVPFVPDFRWLQDRSDTPWYASMSLFRQSRPGVWEDVLGQVGEQLRALMAASMRQPLVCGGQG